MLKPIVLLALLTSPALAAERPPKPTHHTDAACEWQWLEGQGVGLWAEDCKLATGHWQVRWDEAAPGFALWVGDERVGTVVQLFKLPEGATIDALLPDLRKRALIADSNDCIFQPAAIRAAPRTFAFFEVKPVGEKLKAFNATPSDQVPEPPCGDYAWSTHGTRYFTTDLRHPGTVVYVDEGQDGTMIDPTTITLY